MECEEDDSDQEIYTMFLVNHGPRKSPYMVDVELNGLKIQMELDTGTSLSIVGQDIFNQLKSIGGPSLNLHDSKLTLKTYI